MRITGDFKPEIKINDYLFNFCNLPIDNLDYCKF